jgi:hypothetical protein
LPPSLATRYASNIASAIVPTTVIVTPHSQPTRLYAFRAAEESSSSAESSFPPRITPDAHMLRTRPAITASNISRPRPFSSPSLAWRPLHDTDTLAASTFATLMTASSEVFATLDHQYGVISHFRQYEMPRERYYVFTTDYSFVTPVAMSFSFRRVFPQYRISLLNAAAATAERLRYDACRH